MENRPVVAKGEEDGVSWAPSLYQLRLGAQAYLAGDENLCLL